MEQRVRLEHHTRYDFKKEILLGPHIVRLKPTPNCRTEIIDYQLEVLPGGVHRTSLLDVYSNSLSRLVYSTKLKCLELVITCEAVIRKENPLDFFVELYAADFPFSYVSKEYGELLPFLSTQKSEELQNWLKENFSKKEKSTVSVVLTLNQKLFETLKYNERYESGVQAPEETLLKGSGSCRDYAWLLVQLYRTLGIASRFVSGYMVDLHASILGKDNLALHAWVEVYLPGAGWIGLDPTSGLITGQQYIPLCASPHYKSASPVEGTTEVADVSLTYSSKVSRIP